MNLHKNSLSSVQWSSTPPSRRASTSSFSETRTAKGKENHKLEPRKHLKRSYNRIRSINEKIPNVRRSHFNRKGHQSTDVSPIGLRNKHMLKPRAISRRLQTESRQTLAAIEQEPESNTYSKPLVGTPMVIHLTFSFLLSGRPQLELHSHRYPEPSNTIRFVRTPPVFDESSKSLRQSSTHRSINHGAGLLLYSRTTATSKFLRHTNCELHFW